MKSALPLFLALAGCAPTVGPEPEPARDPIVRLGACGATALSERLVFLALEA